MTHGTSLIDELKWRGLFTDATPGLTARLAKGPITGYVGFDPTAPSLQVGNLVPVMLLAHLQRAGGKPIVLMGGGTGMIGDPSGKRSERPLMDIAQIDANVDKQKAQFARFFSFGAGKTDAVLLDNSAWLRPLNLIAFLRDIGKHFTLSYMLQKESVKARMEEGISYTEFSYMLLQAYDFLHLYRAQRCELQMGGSDQWGNITAGAELVRKVEGGEAHGLSAPLITTASGVKFGKSEGQSVWLDAGMTSPYTFYNFWVNVDDRDVARHLAMFTFKTKSEIDALMAEHKRDGGARIPHHALALDVTARVHGADAATKAEHEARTIHAKDAGFSIGHVLGAHASHSFTWDPGNPPKFEDVYVAAGLSKSKGDARRLMAGNGLYFCTPSDPEGKPEAGAEVPKSAIVSEGGKKYLVLRKGKKSYAVLEINAS